MYDSSADMGLDGKYLSFDLLGINLDCCTVWMGIRKMENNFNSYFRSYSTATLLHVRNNIARPWINLNQLR